MQHIFCKNENKAQERLQKMYDAYKFNSAGILKLLNECVSGCSKCFQVYLNSNLDTEIEKERICTNFTPEKVYDWRLLLDDTIFAEYRACKNYPSALTGFKGIVYLIKEKIQSDSIWKKIRLETVTCTSKEVKVLLGNTFERSVAYFKAILFLRDYITHEYYPEMNKILMDSYIENKKDNKEFTTVRELILECLKTFKGDRFDDADTTTSKNDLEFVFNDLLQTGRFDLIADCEAVFSSLDIGYTEILKNVMCFDSKVFHFLVNKIEVVDLRREFDTRMMISLLEFLSDRNELRQRELISDTQGVKMKLLLREVVFWIVINANRLSSNFIEKLMAVDFGVFKGNAYFVLFLNLILDLKITKLSFDTSDESARLLVFLADSRIQKQATFERSVVGRFLDEIAAFKDHMSSVVNVKMLISKKLCLDCENAMKFMKIFDADKDDVRHVITNLIFDDFDPELFVGSIIHFSRNTLEYLLQVMKSKAISKVLTDKVSGMIDRMPKVEVNIDSGSEGCETDIHKLAVQEDHIKDRKMLKVVLKPKRKVEECEYSQSFVNIKRNPVTPTLVENQERFKELKKIAAKINEENAEKEAVIIRRDPCVSTTTQDILIDSDVKVLEMPAHPSPQVRKSPSKKEGLYASADTQQHKFSDGNPHSKISFSSMITQRSGQAINSSKSVLSQTRGEPLIEDFMKECLFPHLKSSEVVVSEIPGSFDSYQEYFDVFNPLRKRENRASITSSIFNRSPYLICRIYDVGERLRIRCHSKSELEVYDLLYFSQQKTYFGSEDTSKLAEDLKNGSFLGIVTSIHSGHFTNDTEFTDLLEVQISQPPKKLGVGKSIPFKRCSSLVSSMREYFALCTISNSHLLKYILRPTFLRDYLEKKVSWDDKRNRVVVAESPTVNTLMDLENNESINKLIEQLVGVHHLNESQANAVARSFFTHEKFVLIQGPPGTGKTTTILSIISTFLFYQSMIDFKTEKQISNGNRNFKILICAPSNTAVDVIVTRLSKGIRDFSGGHTFVNFLRTGVNADTSVAPYTLEYLANKTTGVSKAKIRQELFESASVICTTLNSSVSEAISTSKFDLLIIDEACQATEISTIIPFRYNPRKVIMIGDPQQLPPTIISSQQQLQTSLFERIMRFNPPLFLDTQYRMHPLICDLSSRFFYKGLIKTDDRLLSRINTERNAFKFSPLNFVDVTEPGEAIDRLRSYTNVKECEACELICRMLDSRYRHLRLSVVILTPYKGQATMIKQMRYFVNSDVVINTIDGFQGQECDVTILSTVRQSGLGFTCDFRRINVAITRAKKCLIILGNKKCLSQNSEWKQIIANIADLKKQYVFTDLFRPGFTF